MTDPIPLDPKLQEALDLAIALHGRDSRKDSGVPMLAHLLGVCAIVLHDGGDTDEGIAALLHDALEDKGDRIDADEIEARFGRRVRAIVELASDTPPGYRGGPKPAWRERKEDYLARAAAADPALLRVTVADKVDNLRAILADRRRLGDGVWKRFNAGRDAQLWYFGAAVAAYRHAGYAGPVLDEMVRLLDLLEDDARR